MKQRKLRLKLVIIAIIICIVTSTINFQSVNAKITENLPVSTIDENFPDSYMPYINALKSKHPNWKFKAVHTGLDWNTVLSHETYEVNPGISLVEESFGAEWKLNGENNYQDETYVTASKQGVAYVLDPRNFLSDEGIFQFEALRYIDGVQTTDAVQAVLSATPMGEAQYKNKYKLYGNWYDLGTTYAELIHDLSKEVGINPVHIASRIRQENSGNILNNRLINGDYGIYNFFNIGAYETSNASALSNGVARAQKEEWTSVRAGILGGIKYIYEQYVKWGQNTVYFERFDVNNPGTAQWLLGTGYMTNIFGAKTEAKMTYQAYANNNLLNYAFEFDIPVYENMPNEPVSMPVPDIVSFTPDNTRVYLDDPSDSGVNDTFPVRMGPDTSTGTLLENIVETKDGAENRTKFTRIGIGQNTLYDKIKYDDGRIGYVLKKWIYEYKYTKVESISLNTTYSNMDVGEKLQLVADVRPSNALDKSVKWTSSNSDIASVDNNGNVTALSEGVVTITATTNDQNKSATCTLNIKTSTKVTGITLGSREYTVYTGLALRLVPTIHPSTALNKEYRVEIKDTSIAKVDGKNIVGVSVGSTIVTFITEDGNYEVSATINVKDSKNKDSIIVNEPLKYENNLITGVDVNNNTVNDIKNNISTNYEMKFIDISGNELKDTDRVGTDTKIHFINDGKKVEEYTILIYGDVDGSGTINARDLLMLQRYINKMYDLDPVQVKASIIDKKSSEPKAVDLLKIQRHILGMYVIEQ